jgi:hypothetical protein
MILSFDLCSCHTTMSALILESAEQFPDSSSPFLSYAPCMIVIRQRHFATGFFPLRPRYKAGEIAFAAPREPALDYG